MSYEFGYGPNSSKRQADVRNFFGSGGGGGGKTRAAPAVKHTAAYAAALAKRPRAAQQPQRTLLNYGIKPPAPAAGVCLCGEPATVVQLTRDGGRVRTCALDTAAAAASDAETVRRRCAQRRGATTPGCSLYEPWDSAADDISQRPQCACGLHYTVVTSRSAANPGRRFYSCSNGQPPSGCGQFGGWLSEPGAAAAAVADDESPHCSCAHTARRATVRAEGNVHRGRQYWTCAATDNKCGFFQWCDDDDDDDDERQPDERET